MNRYNPLDAILWKRTDFSFRKLKRKVKSDGVSQALLAATELLVRKKLGRPIFDRVTDYGFLQTVPRSDIPCTTSEIISIDSSTSVKGSVGDPPFVAEFDGGFVFPMTGLALTDEFEIIEESVANPASSRQFTMAALSRHCFFDDVSISPSLLFQKMNRLTKSAPKLSAASPLSPRHPNYYHWMIETVPRIRYLREYEAHTGTDVTLLVPDDLPLWMDETLTLLDWPDSKVERATESMYQIEYLIIPSFPELLGEDYRWIRKQVLTNASPNLDFENIGKNVYISRSKAIERRVSNEDEIINTLSNYDFEVFHLEEQYLSQNAHLFNNADLIVGPHGAGLTDLIFCSDSAILELFGSKIKPPYENLASVLDVEYDTLECSPDSTDIIVDPERLESKIKQILE